MYKDIHDMLTLLAGKILLRREESEFNRDMYLSVKDIKEKLTAMTDGGSFFCPLCDSLIECEGEEEVEEEWHGFIPTDIPGQCGCSRCNERRANNDT